MKGYIKNFTSTVEGASVKFTCDDDDNFTVANCKDGYWKPNPIEFCSGDNTTGRH